MTLLIVFIFACSGSAPSLPGAESGLSGAVRAESRGLAEDLARTRAFHATRPRIETPLGVGTSLPEGLTSLSAASCGACHPAIYEEWRISTHAAAWRDRQYQAELGKSGNRWLCLNCHTPLLVQQDLWPVDLVDGDVERPVLVPNPVFDASLRREGITCVACHLREGEIQGPGLGGEAPHAVVVNPDFRSEALCLRCHEAVATYPGKDFVCTFETGTEWRDGPWDDEGIGCTSCHMPTVERPAAVGGPVRTVRQHWWRGAGIPKDAAGHPPEAANPVGLKVSVEGTPGLLRLDLTNARAGHRLPTGDPERWVSVDVVFVDSTGEAVGEPWQHRIGQEWTWHPVPVKQSDNRLAPRETRRLEVPTPPRAIAALIEASSHRMKKETAAYHHLEDYPISGVTHRLVVPIAR